MRLLDSAALQRPTPLEEAYQVFRLERQGNLLAPRTLEFYDRRVGELIDWLRRAAPEVERVDDVDVNHLRAFRAYMAERRQPDGKLLQAETLHASHRAIHTFLAWAEGDGYRVDGRTLRLRAPRRPHKEATVYHLTQLRAILAACRRPEETMAVRILVGSGVRISELSGLALRGPDGLSDVMLDSLERGRAELRVRWDAGAKRRKARRVPITPQLALAIKRYSARDRVRCDLDVLLVNRCGRAYGKWGIDAMLDRVEERVGFRVHAHGFRHTFATVATQMGWSLERVRAAMGHADYSVLQRYVCLSSERDLGPRTGWAEYIAMP